MSSSSPTSPAGTAGVWRELSRRTVCKPSFASLSDCRVDLEANRWGIVVPGCDSHLPDGVLVREIAEGSFEQVTLRLACCTRWRVATCRYTTAPARSSVPSTSR